MMPALVFFVLATFYLLLVWRDTRDARYLIPAGITAGFCYAIKMPGAVVLPLALAFVIAKTRGIRNRDVLRLAGAALVVISPWMLRAAILSSNPVAPLFNGLFRNRHFHALIERQLGGGLPSLRDLPWWGAPYELTVGGRFQGIIGPVFLLLPLGLLALRRLPGRLCWLAAACLVLPWFWNPGTRFVMPALPFLALALLMALPKPMVWACLALQIAACWPPVVDRYDYAHIWRLHTFPWQAALRIQPEHDYLRQRLDEYIVAQIVEHDSKPGERIFSLISVATAYTDREILQFWHSARAEQLTDSLRLATVYRTEPFFDVRASWPQQLISGLRIRLTQANPAEWCIHDIKLFSGEYRIYNSAQWRLRAWPNVWEAPLAFDENVATRWRTWQPMRARDVRASGIRSLPATERRGDDFAYSHFPCALRILRTRTGWMAADHRPAGHRPEATPGFAQRSDPSYTRRGVPLHPGGYGKRGQRSRGSGHGRTCHGMGHGKGRLCGPRDPLPYSLVRMLPCK